jgi:hypothetical protein
MAVHKVIRSTPPAQPNPQHTKTTQPQPQHSPQQSKTTRTAQGRPDHQLKAEIFDTLRHLNRGYGVALAAFDKLEVRDRQHPSRAFSAAFLHGYRNRTEALRAQANRDLLLLLAGREEHEAERFDRLCGQPGTSKPKGRA